MMNPVPISGQRKEILSNLNICSNRKKIFCGSILNKKLNLENDRGKRYGTLIPCVQ